MTYANEKFLLHDKRKSAYGGRLIIFSSEEQLKVLLQSDVLFADGTFKVAPKLFEQLYVIHEFRHGEGTNGLLLFRLMMSVDRKEKKRLGRETETERDRQTLII